MRISAPVNENNEIMNQHTKFLCALSLFSLSSYSSVASDVTTPVIENEATRQWNGPQAPQHLYGDTYYVGVAGLSSVLIKTDRGLILIDGDLVQSVPLIEAHIRSLGFRVEDIKYIVNSHTHFDHAGGIAALQRDSGAQVLASPSSAVALRQGFAVADDPQFGYVKSGKFPKVHVTHEISDGEKVTLGNTTVTAHFTPGHTPGGTTWTWDSCEKQKCLHMVYVDSLAPVSAPGFHFTADAKHADLTASFRKSIQTVAALPCDILVSVHPDQSGLQEKLKSAETRPAANPFFDPDACKKYASDAQAELEARIAQENAEHH
jgi:metallo-beta-lactamase class B